MKTKALISMALVLGAGLSCDMNPTRPPTTGSISIVLVSPSGSAFSADGVAGDLQPFGDERASIALDGARVTVSGPTTKTVSSTTPTGGTFNLSVTDLPPGSYTVTVEGLSNGQVAHFGQTSGVTVTAGASTPANVTFPVFQPQVPNATVEDTVDVLRFTVTYGAVQNATSYVVQWSQSPTMANAQSKTVTETSTEVTVAQEGKYYFTVKAVNAAVSGGGLASTPKSVYVFQGVASVAVSPPTPTIAAGSTQQLAAEARDADNNVVNGVTWFWASSNHSVATVSQTGLVTGVNGGQATITAVGKGTPGSATVGVTALPAVRLAFSIQPGNTTAGQTIPSVQVAVQNLNGQTVTSDNTTQVTIAIGSDAGPGGVLAGLQTVSVVSGVANFNNLSIAKSGSGYTLTASATGLTGATSALFNVLPGAATQLAFIVQPTNAAANQALSPAVQVAIRDALGNRVTSANDAITIAIANNPGTATLGGTKVVNAINGVASFSGLTLDKGGTGYTLSATSGSLTAATSSGFDIAGVLPASQLAFSIQPTNSVAGDALSPAIQVEIRDANGNRVTTARDAVTISIANNPSVGGTGALTGTKTVNAIDGIASFTGVWINKTGTGYTLSATATSLTGTTSSAFNVAPAAAAKLAFTTQPSNVQGNVAMTPAVTVTITDQFDNATSATNSVTIGIGDNPWKTPFATGATLSGTLTAAAVGGVATFNSLRVDKPAPGYTLSASATSLTPATSGTFNTNLTISQVAAGGIHTCAIATGGTYCFGNNNAGQLGAFLTVGGRDSIAALVRGGLTFVRVTAGGNHSCGLTAAGAAYCWGNNGSGQLGNNSTTASPTPVAVAGNLTFASIDAGSSHTCAITTNNDAVPAEDEQVYCWGYNGNGQVGDGQALGTTNNYLTPFRVVEPLQTTTRATQVSAGANHTCVRAANTNAYCWGYNYYGALGNNTTLTGGGQGVSTATPQLVVGGYQWVSISANGLHTCGITFTHASSQPVRCFGYNGSGQLGDGTNTPTSVPVLASSLNWVGVTTGNDHSCALLSTGAGYCWGYNGLGQLGDEATPVSINTPVAINGTFTFVNLDAGSSHTCGRTSTAVYCWGSNTSGQLGSPGANTTKRIPTQIIQ